MIEIPKFIIIDIFLFITTVTTMLVFAYDKVKDEGWETVYLFFNKSFLNIKI